MTSVIVVGLGAHGSAAAYHLARRGERVVGLERFARGHELGSSGGLSRIIRLAYFEHPDYVPLLRRAWELWEALAADTATDLLTRTGGLYLGAPESATVRGSLESARRHGLAHVALDGREIARRYPFFRLPPGTVGLLEDQAGFVRPERAIAAHLAQAERHGAELRFGERVVRWHAHADRVTVETDRTSYQAERLVLAVGAWMPRLAREALPPLAIERVPLFWFEPADPAPFALGRMPVWIAEGREGTFYGFPHLPEQGLKVARHGSGVEIEDPDHLDRAPRAVDEERLRDFLRRWLPDASGPLRHTQVCMYTKTPDEHFIIDLHPRFPNVVLASPCSGHGFKFASVVGEALADLALEGKSRLPIGFLSLARFRATAVS